jgi:hypothetical protein
MAFPHDLDTYDVIDHERSTREASTNDDDAGLPGDRGRGMVPEVGIEPTRGVNPTGF